MGQTEKCLHEGTIIYGELLQEDGQPQYKVVCQDCGSDGVIMLDEGANFFEVDDWKELQ